MTVDKQNSTLSAQIYHCTAALSSSEVAPTNWSDKKGSNAAETQELPKITRAIDAIKSTEQETPSVKSACKI